MTRKTSKAVALIFVLSISIGCVALSTRFLLRVFYPTARHTQVGHFLLSGGAVEVAGTPRARPLWKRSLEWELSENHPFKVFILETVSCYERLIRWNIPLLQNAGSPFAVSKNFLGSSLYLSSHTSSILADNTVSAISKVSDLLDVPVIYLVPPSRFDEQDRLYDDVFNFERSIQHGIAARVQAAGYSVINLNRLAMQEGRDAHQSFFATDHHFTPETGLWVAQKLGACLFEDFQLPVDTDMLKSESFGKQVRHSFFLGSIGKRFSLARCKPDDFSLMGTLAPISFQIEIPSLQLNKTGGPKELVNWNLLGQRKHLYRTNPYGAYSWGDNPLVTIRNTTSTNNVRLLLFSDSIDNVLLPMLAPSVAEVTSIDLRHFKGPLSVFLADNHFDAVIFFWRMPYVSYNRHFERIR